VYFSDGDCARFALTLAIGDASLTAMSIGARARSIAVAIAIAAALVLVAEGLLRLAGFPDGRFRFSFVNRPGLYAPDWDEVVHWGDFPYRIRTNSLGLRSPEPMANPKTRIVAVGDSITDGFYVDNEATYPMQLARVLAEEHHRVVDVQNVARGQASIDKELALTKRVALPLHPDVVVLTFVTNDIVELRGKSRAELLDGSVGLKTRETVSRWLITRTALGEQLYDRVLRRRTPRYARDLDPAHIDGNDRYDDNARRFRELAAPHDGVILNEPFSVETEQLIATWISLFDDLARLCSDAHAQLVLVYFPAYSQVYLDGDSFRVRDLLREEAARRSVAFLDLTDELRRHGREQPLHFAPVDYHLNAAGNALFARTLARFLVERRLIP
jgi:lysophospholipase L1-like esterase